MKKLLLPVCALLSTGVFAQTYFSDDFSGGIAAWTLTDDDGDGNDWGIFDSAGPQGNVATSASWAGAPLNPDNWMISPAIDLSAASDPNTVLDWSVYAQDQAWADENYTVYVGTSAAIADLMMSDITFNEIVGTSADYMSRTLNIADLNGESAVYVAFRHHDVSDQFRINIDDVVVRTVLSDDIEMISVNTDPVVEPGMVDITGTVKNNGANTITSFDVDWNDGTSHNATITATINPGETYNFTHPTQLDAAGGVTYDMTVCATYAEDLDAANNCVDATINGVGEIPQKYVVGEEKTGTWCGWCPRGDVFMNIMDEEEYFIGIAVHNSDPMVVTAYDSGINTYVPGGYPGGGIDRVVAADPSAFPTEYVNRLEHIAPASVDVSFEEVGSNIEVTVSADFVAALSGDYRLAVVVTEDGVTGTGSGYNQVNYYSGGGAGAMGGYEDLPDPVPAADMVYNHVARALGNNEILGEPGSLPASIEAGTTESYTYTIPMGAEWDAQNLHYVGLLVNGTTGEILNAGKTSPAPIDDVGIEENTANFELNVFPNPASEFTYVQVGLVEAADVTVEVYNMLGEIVYSNSTQNLSAGKYNYTVDVNALSSGVYTVRTMVNSSVKTVKLSVQ